MLRWRTWLCAEVRPQGERRRLEGRVQEDRRAGDARDRRRGRVDLGHEVGQRALHGVAALRDHHAPPSPGGQQRRDGGRDQQGDPAAVGDLGDVGGEEGHLDAEEERPEHHRAPGAPLPEPVRDGQEQDRVDDEGAGDGDAVGGRQPLRRLEGQHQPDHRREQDPVDHRHVDLPDLARGGVADRHARQEAEAHRLAGHREGAGDDRLRGDDGGHRGEHDHRDPRPVGQQQEEGAVDRRGVAQDQRALAEVVEGQGREHEQEPGAADGRRAEVAHVGVERLGAGDGQHDRAAGDEGQERVVHEEGDRVGRRQPPDDRRVARRPRAARRRRSPRTRAPSPARRTGPRRGCRSAGRRTGRRGWRA